MPFFSASIARKRGREEPNMKSYSHYFNSAKWRNELTPSSFDIQRLGSKRPQHTGQIRPREPLRLRARTQVLQCKCREQFPCDWCRIWNRFSTRLGGAAQVCGQTLRGRCRRRRRRRRLNLLLVQCVKQFAGGRRGEGTAVIVDGCCQSLGAGRRPGNNGRGSVVCVAEQNRGRGIQSRRTLWHELNAAQRQRVGIP